MSRKKLVIINTREGASVRTVRTSRTFSELTSWVGVVGALRLRFTVGIVTLSSPIATAAKIKNSKNVSFFKFTPARPVCFFAF